MSTRTDDLAEDALPAAALPAWHAYRAMQASKTTHLEFLVDRTNDPAHGLAAQARQATLLEAHAACVARFTEAMRALSLADRAAHSALVAHITQANAALGGPGPAQH